MAIFKGLINFKICMCALTTYHLQSLNCTDKFNIEIDYSAQ